MWQDLYNLGARKVWLMSLPPLGCLPVSITLFGSGSNECVERINSDALHFNNKLNASTQVLQKQLSGLTITFFDIYTHLFDIIQKPSDYGTFFLTSYLNSDLNQYPIK